MKNVRKLLALLLAMAMLFALCACGDNGDNKKKDEDKGKGNKTEASVSANDPSDAQPTQSTQSTQPTGNSDVADSLNDATLQGNWKASLNVDAMMHMMGDEQLEMYQELGINMGICTMDMTFENGQATVQFSDMADWYVGVVENYIEWLSNEDNFLSFMADMMSTEEEPLTPEDIRAQLEAEGTSVEEAIASMKGEMDLDALKEMMAAMLEDDVKEYTLSGNTVNYKDGAVWTVAYENGNLYVLSIEADGETVTFNKGDFVLTKN